MIYDEKNNIEVDGNGNIILQDVNAETVTINYNQSEEIKKLISLANEELLARIQEKISGKETFREVRRMLDNYLELSPEIKIVKEQIKKKVNELFLKVRQPLEVLYEKTTTNDFDSIDVDWDALVESIKWKNCVLFIGPEISTNNEEKSLHEEFIESTKSKVMYDPMDGFFMPNTENKLKPIAKGFYKEKFPLINKNGRTLLEKLVQIPFKLIIPVSPDDTIKDIFLTHNIKHKFCWYDNTLQDFSYEIFKDTTVIYNALGCASEDGKYIFTHKLFNDYVKIEDAKRIPVAIEKFLLEDASHCLFFGFNFDKWYYRLLLFALNIDKTKESFTFEQKDKTLEINKDFIKAQFNISFINTGYDNFVNLLLKKCSDAGLSKPLHKRFIESIKHELEAVIDKTYDSSKLEELRILEDTASEIERKINNWLNNAEKN